MRLLIALIALFPTLVLAQVGPTAPDNPFMEVTPAPVCPAPDPEWAKGWANLSWEAPTQRTDGSALTNLAGYNLYFGTKQPLGFLTSLPAAALAHTVEGLPAGMYLFGLTAKDTNGFESAMSNVVSKEIIAPPRYTVQLADQKAYKLRQKVDGFEFVEVGVVPVGTVCDENFRANDKMVVPRAALIPRSRFEIIPVMVFATCPAS